MTSITDHQQLYLLVAAVLFLVGIHGFVDARWRRIRDQDVVTRLKAAAT